MVKTIKADLFKVCEWIVKTYPSDVYTGIFPETKLLVELKKSAEALIIFREERKKEIKNRIEQRKKIINTKDDLAFKFLNDLHSGECLIKKGNGLKIKK